MDPYKPYLPFPFNLIPFIAYAAWIGLLCLIIYASIAFLVSSILPEDVGSFIGRVVNAFQKGVAK